MSSVLKAQFIFFLCFFSIYQSPLFARETISIATSYFPPYSSYRHKSEGFVNHVIRESFKLEKYATQFKYLPWKRSKLDTIKGKYQATSYWTCSKNNQKVFLCSDPITEEKYLFFFRADHPLKEWNTLNDLKSYEIGATAGYTYTAEFWEAAKKKNLNIQVVSNDRQNMVKLIRKRINLLISEPHVISLMLRNHFEPEIARLIKSNPKPLNIISGRLMFPKSRKDAPKLHKIFNRGLKKLKLSRKFDRLYQDLRDGKYTH